MQVNSKLSFVSYYYYYYLYVSMHVHEITHIQIDKSNLLFVLYIFSNMIIKTMFGT